MTIHFAAAQTPFARLIAKPGTARIAGKAANDNGFIGHSGELRAALRHFAEHGLGAAQVAQQNAERAFFAGDRAAYLHWLGICRTLDRRLAGALADRIEPGND